MSRATKTSAWMSAAACSCGSSSSITFAMAMSTVSPAPQPAARYVVPKSRPVRTISAGGTPSSSSASTDFAITSERLSSSPSRSRRCQRATSSPSGRAVDVHVVTVDLDVEALGVVGPEVERATRLEVEPRVVPVAGDQARLDRSLVQREAHVRAPVFDGERPAVVPEHDDRQVADLGDELALPCAGLPRFPPAAWWSTMARPSVS